MENGKEMVKIFGEKTGLRDPDRIGFFLWRKRKKTMLYHSRFRILLTCSLAGRGSGAVFAMLEGQRNKEEH